jgi:ABC-type sugar transport system ATPase subunit
MTAHLALDAITKTFPGVQALGGVHLDAYRGEAMALMGANGAGKSTLMNILGGIVQMDAGAISIDEISVAIGSPRDAKAHGIAFVQQELNVVPSMTVAENIFITSFPVKAGVIDKMAMRKRAKGLLGRLNCPFGVDETIERLSIGDRQMVEIAGALAREPKIIIFDEPTSSLTSREKRKLFEVIALLKQQGVVIIYITHFLDEIFEICERVTVLRNGTTVGAGMTTDFTPVEIVQLMLGQTHSQERLSYPTATRGTQVLKASNLSREGVLADVSLSLHAGEIVGLWGLLGSGRTELIRALTGLDPIDAGEIDYDAGTGLKRLTPHQLHRKVGLVTEDRRGEGLLLPQSVLQNLSLASLGKLLNRFLMIDRGREQILGKGLIDRLGIKVSALSQRVGTLSGGNQQKVVFGRWLATTPQLYFLDEPTRGLDVGAKTEILKLVVELARAGATVLLISSEVEELIRVCDRYLVMSRGRIVGELPGAATKAQLMDAVSGKSFQEALAS